MNTNHQSPTTNHDIYIVAAFYHFAPVPDTAKLQKHLKVFMAKNEVKGTIILAPEGVNGTVTGSRAGVDTLLNFLRALDGFADLLHKEAQYERHGFERTKVKCKAELIGLGVPTFPAKIAGEYVEPKDWNALIAKGLPVIDTRNDYEVEMGSFAGATDPKTKRFKDLVAWTEENLDPARDKEVAMYCTGGIRCEKFSSYLKAKGFDKVYHLKGGILRYLEEIPQAQSKWSGDCYVFDERIAVDHDLQPSGAEEICPRCNGPIWTKHRADAAYVKGVCCPRCA